MYKCEVCGGKLNMTIGSDVAVCDSCGNSATIPDGEVRKYQDIYKAAELLMQRNSVSGYSEAKMRLQTIAFIPEAEEKITVCENRIAELRERQKTQAQTKAETDKRDSKTGIIPALANDAAFSNYDVICPQKVGYIGNKREQQCLFL